MPRSATRPSPRRGRTPSIAALVREVITDAVSYSGDGARVIFESEEHEQIVQRMLEDLPAHAKADLLSLDDRVAFSEQISCGLAPDLREKYRRLSEHQGHEYSAREEAAYNIGVEVGRMLAGGVR